MLDESGNIIYKNEESPRLTTDSKYGESERTGFKTSFSSDPGAGVEHTRDSDIMISKNASEVKRGSTPNLEEIRGRDVDAMTVDGLEYSVTATVNGYTARIAE